jgi:hypothetical protein
MNSHQQALVSLSSFVQEKSHALYSYVKLLEGREDSEIRNGLLCAFQYGDEHSDKVVRNLERVLCLFVGYWIVAGFVALRRHKKRKRVQRQAAAGQEPRAGLAYPNHQRKKNQ